MPQGFLRAPGGRKLGRAGRAASARHWRGAPSTGAKAEAQATSAHTQSPSIKLVMALLLCMEAKFFFFSDPTFRTMLTFLSAW